MRVTAWSYSAYALHAECPLKYKLEKIDKIKTPTPPAFAKGRKWHKAMEDFLKEPVHAGSTHSIPAEGAKFAELLLALKEQPQLLVEQQWAFNRKWGQAKWFRDDSTWLRSVVDAGVIFPDYVVEVIDWKTGKKYAENQDQLELFALTAMVRIPQAPAVQTRLAYLESGDEVLGWYDAKDRDKLRAKWEKKVEPMFSDETFAPRPNDKCRFCHFAKNAALVIDGQENHGAGKCRFG